MSGVGGVSPDAEPVGDSGERETGPAGQEDQCVGD